MSEWQFVPAPCHQVECQNCGWERSVDGTREQAIAELKRLGWQLRSNGPWCQECVRDDEMRKDNSEVYSKYHRQMDTGK